MAEEKRDKSLIELLIELIDLSARYIRRQVELTVEKGVSSPIKRAGFRAATAVLAATIIGTALIFVALGLFLLLVKLVGDAWLAFLIVGVILLIAGLLIARKGQREDG